uniref:6-phosphogluconate dehydrogenase NADP-binding domain-containing protein n=1 Tax=Aureoumbra lagunensis TaxID=44058 RepID=A0A6S8CIP4_9STRA|mmetsp:Transcript_21149/g.25444  ORF Transcript_21149/g.25444 Transcript_21149/m.25444 type:complete len:305 (+) Transcript_21149:108-1022(+)
MGQALAKCLAGAGTPVTIWNRSIKKLDALRDMDKIIVEADIKKAVAASNVVIMNVVGDSGMSTANKVLEAAGSVEKKTLIQWSTHHPFAAKTQQSIAQDLGWQYTAGAMLTDPPNMCQDGAFFYVSGQEEYVTPLISHLSPLGKILNVGTDIGLGSLIDIAMLQTGFYGIDGFLMSMAAVRKYFLKEKLSSEVETSFIKLIQEQAVHFSKTLFPEFYNVAAMIALQSSNTDLDNFLLTLGGATGPRATLVGALKVEKEFLDELNIDSKHIEHTLNLLSTIPNPDYTYLGWNYQYLLRPSSNDEL